MGELGLEQRLSTALWSWIRYRRMPVREVEVAMGRSDGWLRQRRRSGRLSLALLEEAMAVIGLTPDLLMALAYPDARIDVLASFEVEAELAARKLPLRSAIQTARQRFLGAAPLPPLEDGGRAEIAQATELVALRQRDPAAALARVGTFVKTTTSPEAAVIGLVVWATCLDRDPRQLARAAAVLGSGIAIARRHGLHQRLVELTRLAAEVAERRNQSHQAFALAETACILATEETVPPPAALPAETAAPGFGDRLSTALWQWARYRGTSIRDVETAIGRSDGWLRQRRRSGSLALSTVRQVMQLTALEPGTLVALAFPSARAAALEAFEIEAELESRKLRLHNAVVAARQLFLAEDWSPERPETWPDEIEQVATIEQLRRRDPLAALARVSRFVARGRSPEAVATALGVWASCLRRDPRQLKRASVILGLGLAIARRFALAKRVVELAVRATFVVKDRGELERARALAETTLLLAAAAGDKVRLGHGHFLRAFILRELGEPQDAIPAYQAALRYLESQDERAATLQGLGFTYLALGDLEQAHYWTEMFEREASTVHWDANSEGRAYWLKAALAAKREAWKEAAALYEAAGERLADQPVDAAMIAAERTRALLHLGRRYEAIAFARRQCHLVIPLEDVNPLAAAALADLIRAGSEGEQALTLQVVNAVAENLAGAREISARTPGRS